MNAAESFAHGNPLVFDTSAWNRQRDPAVASRWRASLAAGELVVCPVVTLELLSSARDQAAFDRLDTALSALPQAPVTRATSAAAIGGSRKLGGSRRIPATDYLIAAAAAKRGFGVLHYDSHFDLLGEVLGLESVWVAEPGRLD